jgi:hypothetical protein
MPTDMRRVWLRWAVNRAQTEFKVGRGNAADEQQAAYLVDCDLYLTADKRFHLVLGRVAQAAPFAFAPSHVPATADRGSD